MARRGEGGRAAAVAGLAGVLALAAAGCAPPDRPAAPGRARPVTVERLAAAAGCAPVIEAAASGPREGTCLTSRGSYTIATFTTSAALRAWLDAARSYRGSCLVGDGWVVAGPPAALRPLRARLGGRLRPGSG